MRWLSLVAFLVSVAGFTGFAWAKPECMVKPRSLSNPIKQPIAMTGLQPFEGVNKRSLLLGRKVGALAEKCAHLVVVTDLQKACGSNRCSNTVFNNPKRAIPQQGYGQRGILVYDCSVIDPYTVQGDLLLDDGVVNNRTNILAFEVYRVGDSLWKQVVSGGEYIIELPTEAASSHLTYKNGEFQWKEFGGD